MPKKIFWPAALVTMGLIILASNFNLLPSTFGDLWPIILVIVGLGGLITSDRDEWMIEPKKAKATSKKKASKKATKRKTSKKK